MKTHISLNVANIANSVDFYSRMLGADPVKQESDYAKFVVSDPPLNLTVNLAEFTPGGSLSHLGLQVSSSQMVNSIGGRWQSAGLDTEREMQTDCCYALQDKIWVSDPDGNRWEVFTVLADTEPAEHTASTCCNRVSETVSISSPDKSNCC